jgi:hypothetical protein
VEQVGIAFVAALFAVVLALAVKVPGDVRQHDRIVGELDEDLEAWVLDDDLRLKRELEAIRDEHNSRGMLYSSFRLKDQAEAKERALRAYREQERRAQRIRLELRMGEGVFHRAWRSLTSHRFPKLYSPSKAHPTLERWRAPVGYNGASARPVDPTTRRL